MARRLGTGGHAGPGLRAWCLALALVLALHALVLAWLAMQWQSVAVLQPMLNPMFTREIQPSNAVFKPKPAGASVKSTSDATELIADRRLHASPVRTAPRASTPSLSATPSVSAASAPADTASAAVADASAPSTENVSDSPSAGTGTSAIASTGTSATPTAAARSASEPADGSPTDTVRTDSELSRWPVDTRLSYTLGGSYRGDLHGDAQVVWQRQADRYQVQVLVRLGWLASLDMTSQGQISAQGLSPSAYDEKLGAIHRTVQLGPRRLTLGNGDQVPRPPRVQDTASQFVELTWRFLSGQLPLAQGASVRYPMARPAGVDDWVYDVVGLETLSTRFGPVPAWHLVPRPLDKPRGSITAEMWFAPSLQYLPVRIKMNLGLGNYVDLLIDKVEQASLAADQVTPAQSSRP